MKKDNIEALKSSVVVGVAMMLFVADVMYLFGSSHILVGSLVGGLFGFLMGLLSTWDTEE